MDERLETKPPREREREKEKAYKVFGLSAHF